MIFVLRSQFFREFYESVCLLTLQLIMALPSVSQYVCNYHSNFIPFHLYTAGLDYEATTSSLVFIDQSRESVFVSILNDSLFEDSETFFGLLSASSLPPNVRLAPTRANATILDDEGIFACN